MNFKAYIFDLDGTLLDTLADLVNLTNVVLEQNGWPLRTSEEILSYIGDGGFMLFKRAAPADVSEDQLKAAFQEWGSLYTTLGHAQTKPYPGIPEALTRLKQDGAKLGVLSNKIDFAVKEVIGKHFPGVFDIARGECDEIPRKPNPQGLLYELEQLGVKPAEAAYVGDAATDMEVARLAHVFSVGVSWGYEPVDDLLSAGAQVIISQPHELLDL